MSAIKTKRNKPLCLFLLKNKDFLFYSQGSFGKWGKKFPCFFCKISKNIGIPGLKRRQKSRFKQVEEDWL